MGDDEVFRQVFADVRPLKKTDRVLLKKSSSTSEQQLERLRANAEQGHNTERSAANVITVSDDFVEKVDPHDVLSFKRPGIQAAVFKKLRLGKYPIEGRLDLHNKKVSQARLDVVQFIADGMQYDMRCLLIVHGKGARNLEDRAVLKSHVAKWLKEQSDVMAYHSAAARHGGVGAVYVMLRKSEKSKEMTRQSLGRPES